MPIKAYYLAPDGNIQHDLSKDELIKAYESKQGLLWVDVSETTEEEGIFLEQSLHCRCSLVGGGDYHHRWVR